jgi:hypothetical protein
VDLSWFTQDVLILVRKQEEILNDLMYSIQEQTAGLDHNMEVDNSSVEMVEQLKYLGKTLKFCHSEV